MVGLVAVVAFLVWSFIVVVCFDSPGVGGGGGRDQMSGTGSLGSVSRGWSSISKVGL